ncbi:MAG: transposase family protein [Gammaproteobacteria bacterium]|nr:transposase family protein [Gammaproteobacteria bacterium]
MQRRLSPECKKSIGQQAVSGSNVSQVAQRHEVCRNTVYTQKRRALAALDDAFLAADSDEFVLFNLPVTKPFLRQVVLGILMICKGSYRSTQMFLQSLFDTEMSIGTIHNIHDAASQKATEINASYSLQSIKQSASDEIYHRNKPHLAVVDVRSRYCASLAQEDSRDAETWAIHLLDLIEQGFQPEVNISDQGSGMASAFKEILPDTEHRFDHFHLIKGGKELVRYLKNIMESAITHQIKLHERMERAKQKGKGNTLSVKLAKASRDSAQAEAIYRHVSTLNSWLQYDILQLPGHNPVDREMLFDFVLEELSTVADTLPRIKEFVASLTHQKENLLAVSHVLNREFQQIAIRYRVTEQDVWDVCYVARYDIQASNYHYKADALASQLGPQFEEIEDEVLSVIAVTPRCSSMVENFNSRLRPYLDSRKQITSKRLELIQFYLNHQVFLRSQHDYMQGRTPAEVLTGTPHPNWLEMLGFQRFKQAA